MAYTIRDIMKCYDERFVKTKEDKLKHLIARRAVKVTLSDERIAFKALAEKLPVEEMYEHYKKHEGNPLFQGWKLDFHRHGSLPDTQSLGE